MTGPLRYSGLTPRATANEIKSAYRKARAQVPPDVSMSPDANARVVKINEAYQILSDPHLRWAYDDGQYADSKRGTFYASRQAEIVNQATPF